MTDLNLLCAGAAQSLVRAMAACFEVGCGCTLVARFGPVGALASDIRAGTAPDVVIVSAQATAELIGEGRLVGGSDAPLGTVHTALAVRGEDPAPAIGDEDELKRALSGATAILAPDPVKATAGFHFAGVLDRLGLREAVAARLRLFPNGEATIRELAGKTTPGAIACAQATEIMGAAV